MRFSYTKDINSTTNEFLGKVMFPETKNNATKDKELFKSYKYSLSQHDNHGLLAETFFHNILLNKHIFSRMDSLTRLY